MFNTGNVRRDCEKIRMQSPLVINLTNIVAANFTANALLSAGASPLMACEPQEMEELVAAAEAVVINCGSVDALQARAMDCAASAAARLGKPWVLDPAGVGASRFRSDTVRRLIKDYHPTVISANASEISFLAGGKCRCHGVDSLSDSASALDAAVSLSLETGSVISLSGSIDFITDGRELVLIENGTPLMSRITAMGCAAAALTGAFLAVDRDRIQAAAGAMAVMGVSGEKAASPSKGPGSMAAAFLDALAGTFDSESIRYEQRTI